MSPIKIRGGMLLLGQKLSRTPLIDKLQRAIFGTLIWSSIICLFGMMFVSVFVLTIEMGWVSTVVGIWLLACMLTVISWNWSVK